MPRNKLISLMFILWTLGRRVNLQRVFGVLHGQVELQGYCKQNENVTQVEWLKHQSSNVSAICRFVKGNNTQCWTKHYLNSSSQSLHLVNLTAADEGIYEKKIILSNGTLRTCNITLSVKSPPVAPRVHVSCSNDTLTLTCEVRGEFVLLQWMQNGLPLAADQRFILTENNKTMQVFNLSSFMFSKVTCNVSNEVGFTETHVNITCECTEDCLNSMSYSQDFIVYHIVLPTAITGFFALLIILMCICKCYGCFKSEPPDRRTRDDRNQSIQMQEAVYDEPLQVASATPKVSSLPYVYSDFIKPRASQQTTVKDQDEDFGYSTISDIVCSQVLDRLPSLKAS